MRDISAYLQVDLPEISALAIENSRRIDELSNASSGSAELIEQLSSALTTEAETRFLVDDTLSSAMDKLQTQVGDLSGAFNELCANHDELEGRFNEAFAPTLDSVDPDKHDSPEFLVLKDQSGNGDLYALEMVDGMLAAKKIGFTE